MKTLTSQAEALRYLDGVTVVWLIEASFDEHGLSTDTRRYADSAFTLSSNDYTDLLAVNGLSLGMADLKERGGLAPVYSWSLKFRDELNESHISDTYVLSNDEVVLYYVFVDGTETSSDRIEALRGVIERHPSKRNVWSFRLKDGSRRYLRRWPVNTISPPRYRYLYEPGLVEPIPFGNLNVGPDDGAGEPPALAKVRILDRFAMQGTVGSLAKSASTLYQWYQQAQRYAEVTGASVAADNVTTFTDASREMILPPAFAGADDDFPTEWFLAADLNTSTSVTVGTGDFLHVWLSGSPKLGEVTAVDILVNATGSWDYEVFLNATSKASGTLTGSQTISLTPLTDYEAWPFALINIKINGNGGDAVVKTIKGRVRFEDFQAIAEAPPDLWQKAEGFEDVTGAYADGAVVDSVNSVLENPVHQIEAMLRASQANGLTEAQIKSGFAAAATSRSSWKFAHNNDEIRERDYIDEVARQAGVHLFPEEDGFNCAAMDKTRDPQHFFHGEYHMPMLNGSNPDPATWEYDFEVEPTDASEILNEFILRYGYVDASGQYHKSKAATGQYRLTGTCSLSNATGRLTDASATFLTDEVVEGEEIYVSGDVIYEAAADATAETWIEVVVKGGGTVPDLTSKTYWLGPNLRGECLLSQLSFKTINALGTQQRSVRDDGGFKTKLIRDDTTADAFLDHNVEWFAFPRDKAEFPVVHSAVTVQRGDVIMLEHQKLQPSKRPNAMTTIDGAHTSGQAYLDVAAGTAGLLRVDDWIFAWSDTAEKPEAMKVTAITTTSRVAVDRAQLNTEAVAFSGGETIYRMTKKWFVMGVQQMSPGQPFFRLKVVQMPNSYAPVGKVVAPGYPDYTSATEIEKVQSGWATLRNGRVVDQDIESNISHVGADSGTYTIV